MLSSQKVYLMTMTCYEIKVFTQKYIIWCYFGSSASVHSNFQAKKEKIEGNMKGDGFQNGGSLIVTSSKNISH